MACDHAQIYQVGIYTTVARVPFRVAKCSGGKMKVHEISVQNQTATAVTALLQFFMGNGIAFPLSFQVQVQQFQMWSKPGAIVEDDVYLVDEVGGTTLSVEVLTESIGTS